jgi:hypothetical protein
MWEVGPRSRSGGAWAVCEESDALRLGPGCASLHLAACPRMDCGQQTHSDSVTQPWNSAMLAEAAPACTCMCVLMHVGFTRIKLLRRVMLATDPVSDSVRKPVRAGVQYSACNCAQLHIDILSRTYTAHSDPRPGTSPPSPTAQSESDSLSVGLAPWQ